MYLHVSLRQNALLQSLHIPPYFIRLQNKHYPLSISYNIPEEKKRERGGEREGGR